MISTDTIATFEKFTTQVKRASQARSKDLRLDMVDAVAIVAEIANVVTRLTVPENTAAKEVTTGPAKMDGGKFKDK